MDRSVSSDSQMSVASTISSSSSHNNAADTSKAAHTLVTLQCYENERWILGFGFGKRLLPKGVDPPRFSDASEAHAFDPPVSSPSPQICDLANDTKSRPISLIQQSINRDGWEAGDWMYAFDFRSTFTEKKGRTDYVRRRLWTRTITKSKADALARTNAMTISHSTSSHKSFAIDSTTNGSDDKTMRVKRRPRKFSFSMSKYNVNNHSVENANRCVAKLTAAKAISPFSPDDKRILKE
eukprot:UC4_evm1s1397